MTSLGYYDRLPAYKDQQRPRGYYVHEKENEVVLSLPCLGGNFPVYEPWRFQLLRELYSETGDWN